MIGTKNRTSIQMLVLFVLGLQLPCHGQEAIDVESIVSAVEYHDQKLISFNATYTIRQERFDPVPGMPHTAALKSSTTTGKILYKRPHFYKVDHHEEIVSSNKSVQGVRHSLRSFDGDSFTRVNHHTKSAEIDTDKHKVPQNPFDFGLLLTNGLESCIGYLTLWHQSVWEFSGIETIDGIACYKLSAVPESYPAEHELWIDPERGYRMIMYRVTRRPKWQPELGTRVETDLYKATGYEEAEPGVWIPSRVTWELGAVDEDGTTYKYATYECTMALSEVNKDYDPSAFHVEIPSGYFVADAITGVSYRQGAYETTLREFGR